MRFLINNNNNINNNNVDDYHHHGDDDDDDKTGNTNASLLVLPGGLWSLSLSSEFFVQCPVLVVSRAQGRLQLSTTMEVSIEIRTYSCDPSLKQVGGL